jgi:hypothetical protein
MSGKYDDIIDLPHHQSEKHPLMSMEERAAQFSPFAALTGYGAVIAETGRLTEDRIELTDEQKDEIDRKLNELLESGDPAVITFFEPDEKKDGGRYVSVRGKLKRYDIPEETVVLETGKRIPVRDLFRIEEASGDEKTS